MGRPFINSSFLTKIGKKTAASILHAAWYVALEFLPFYPLDFHSFSSGRLSLSVALNCTVVLAAVICVKVMQLMSH